MKKLQHKYLYCYSTVVLQKYIIFIKYYFIIYTLTLFTLLKVADGSYNKYTHQFFPNYSTNSINNSTKKSLE